MLLLLQADVAAGWVGPTVALSLVVIALAFVVIALASILAVRQAAREMHQLSVVVESLRADLAPAIQAVQVVSDEGTRLAELVSGEAEEVVRSSRALRKGLQERVTNLEAIYEVLEEEVEETALDVAITLRRFRSGVGWFGLIRRLLRAGRRS